MNEQLAAQLKRLGHCSNVLRRQAAVGVFQLLAAGAARGSSVDAAKEAIFQCLTDRHAEVVDESVSQLLHLAGALTLPGIDASTALQLLLAALDTASTRTSPLLAKAVVSGFLLRQRQAASATTSAVSLPPAEAWARHPLSTAVLAQPSSAQQVLSAACSELRQEAASGSPGAIVHTWESFQPFFSFILLRPLGMTNGPAGASGAASAMSVTNAPSSAGDRLDPLAALALRAALVGSLVRLACCYREVARLVLPLLTGHLACMPLGEEAIRLQAVSFLGDVVDILDNHTPAAAAPAATGTASHAWWWQQLADAASVCVACAAQLSSGGGGSGVGTLVAVMRRLADLGQEAAELQAGSTGHHGQLPGGVCAGGFRGAVWAAWIPELTVLAMNASEQDRCGLFALVAGAMAEQQQQQGSMQQQQQAWIPEAALLVVPLLHSLVLAPGPASKRWAAALLATAQQQQQPWSLPQHSSSPSSAAAGGAVAVSGLRAQVMPSGVCLRQLCCQGDMAVVQAARRLLQQLTPMAQLSAATEDTATKAAIGWLDSLSVSLADARSAAQATASGAGATAFSVALPSARKLRERESGGAAASVAPELGPGAVALLGALLVHSDARIVDAAARCLRQLMLALPSSAPVFLPPLLMQLRRFSGGRGGGEGSHLHVARAQTSLLSVLPAMTTDPTIAAFAMRALQPLMAPSAPPVLRGAALRLAVEGWRITGRGWGRAEAAINGYAPPGDTARAAASPGGLGPRARDIPPLELRLSRAAALRDVCASGSGRALELVGSLQDCLADPSPSVAAMALDAIGALCDEDALDFYAAWKVVAAVMPTPPTAPILAARWVALLASGAFDAEAHPDQAAAVVDLLWAASGHKHPLVRAAAYRALAAYPIPLLEKLEVDEPLGNYTAPLEREARALTAALTALTALAATTAQPRSAAGTGAGGDQPVAQSSASQTQLASAVAHCKEALAAAELLAGMAIALEHDRRRRFLAAAAASTRGGSGTASSQRDESALRHRLLHTARTIALTAGSDARGGYSGDIASGDGSAGVGTAASPGALLLLWLPASASGPSQQPGRQSVSRDSGVTMGYTRLFDDAATRLAWSPWTHPGMAAHAWQAFMNRWLASPGHQGTEGLLQSLKARWREGTAGEAAAACWAAFGLAAAGALSESQMAEALGGLRRLMRGGAGPQAAAPSVVVQAAAAAAVRMLPALHPADWKSRQGVVAAIRAQLLGGGYQGDEEDVWGVAGGEIEESGEVDGGRPAGAGGAGGVRSAAAEALAFAACHALRLGQHDGLGAGRQEGDNPGLVLGASCLSTLLSFLAALQPEEAPGLLNITEQLPPDCRSLVQLRSSAVPDLDLNVVCEEDLWLLPSLRRGITSIAAALNELRPVPALLQALQSDSMRLAAAAAAGLNMATAPPPSARLRSQQLAALSALQDCALVCLDELPDGPQSAQAAVQLLCDVATRPTVDGWLGGLSALGWAQVAGALLQRGMAPHSAQSVSSAGNDGDDLAMAAGRVVEALSALCNGRGAGAVTGSSSSRREADGGVLASGHRGPATWALRCGAAAGLTALLGADVVAGAFGSGLGPDGLLVARSIPWLLTPSTASATATATTTAGTSGSGTAPPSRVRIARSALRALEAAALNSAADGQSERRSGGGRLAHGGAAAAAVLAPLAGWLLAATSVAAAATMGGGSGGAGGRSSGGDGSQLPLLSAYPEDGALRPLAERVLVPGSGEQQLPQGATPRTANVPVAVHLPPNLVETASLLRVLSAAPRLPAAGWETLCRRLLRSPPSHVAAGGGGVAEVSEWQTDASAALRLAVLDLVLTQSLRAESLGMASVLDHAMMPAAFGQLPSTCQVLLLRRLPDAIRCLPANRAGPLLQALPGLAPMGRGVQAAGVDLQVAAWEGLTGLCCCIGEKDASIVSKGITEHLMASISSMAERLPILPSLLPGQILILLDDKQTDDPVEQEQGRQLLASYPASSPTSNKLDSAIGSASSDVGSTGSGGSTGSVVWLGAGVRESAGYWRVWRAAGHCLRRLKQEQAASLTHIDNSLIATAGSSGDAGSREQQQQQQQPERGVVLRCQLRCLLVISGQLSWRELTPCRALVINSRQALTLQAEAIPASSSSSSGGLHTQGAAADLTCVVPFVAAASSCAPQAAQAQLLQEALQAARLCAHPINALVLAAAMVAAWQAGSVDDTASSSSASSSSASSSRAVAAVDAEVFSGDCWSALAGLSHTLPALVAAPAWVPSADSVASGLLAAAWLPSIGRSAKWAVLGGVLALRQWLQGPTWEAVAAAVGGG